MRSTKYQFQINLLSSKAAAKTISPLPQQHTKTTRSNFIQIHHEIGQNFFPLMISIMGFTIEITLNCLRISINYAFLWHITWYLLLLLISIKGISLQPEWVSGLMTWRFEIKLSLKSSLPCYCLDSDRNVNKKRQDQLEIGNKAPENFSLTYKSSRNGWVLTLWPAEGEGWRCVGHPHPAYRNIWLCWVSNEFNSSIPDPAHYGALCFLTTSPPNFLDRLTASLGNQQIHFSQQWSIKTPWTSRQQVQWGAGGKVNQCKCRRKHVHCVLHSYISPNITWGGRIGKCIYFM